MKNVVITRYQNNFLKDSADGFIKHGMYSNIYRKFHMINQTAAIYVQNNGINVIQIAKYMLLPNELINQSASITCYNTIFSVMQWCKDASKFHGNVNNNKK